MVRLLIVLVGLKDRRSKSITQRLENPLLSLLLRIPFCAERSFSPLSKLEKYRTYSSLP